MELCPDNLIQADTCSKRFCHYRNKKGHCSLNFEPEAREYEAGEIAEALQISRQRVWRVYDASLAKLKISLKDLCDT